MRVRLTGPFAELELHRSSGTPGRERVHDPYDVVGVLARAAATSTDILRLRSLLFEVGEHPSLLDDHEVLQRVARLLVSGELELLIKPHVFVGGGSVELSERSEPRTARSDLSPSEITEPDHWVEFVLETDDGTPIPGVRCEITLAWGVTLTRTTDRDGRIRLERLPGGGQCTLRLLETEAERADDPSDHWDIVATAS